MTSLGDSPEAFVVEEVLVVEKGDVVESVVAGFFVVELSADAVVLSAKVENGLFVVVFEPSLSAQRWSARQWFGPRSLQQERL